MGRFGKIKCFLLGCLSVAVLFLLSSILIPTTVSNAVKWFGGNSLAGKLGGAPGAGAAPKELLIEMVVEDIGVSKIDFQPVIILKEKNGETSLPIAIGPAEANAIMITLERVSAPRPLTADLLCSVIDKMGARVDHIAIHDLKDQTFYARIVLEVGWSRIEIDARPSDAIAVALRVEAPIYVAKTVLDKAGIRPKREGGRLTLNFRRTGSPVWGGGC